MISDPLLVVADTGVDPYAAPYWRAVLNVDTVTCVRKQIGVTIYPTDVWIEL